MKKKTTELISTIVKALFAVAMIIWLIKSDKLNFSVIFQALNIKFAIAGLISIGTSLALVVERWRKFLNSQNLSIGFMDAYRLCLIGVFFNFVMPGGVGGDLVKGYYISRKNHHSKLASAMTVFLDRLIGLLAVALIAFVVMLIEWNLVSQNAQLKAVFTLVSLLTLGMLIVWAAILSNTLHNTGLIKGLLHKLPKSGFLLRLYDSLGGYRNIKSIFFSTLFLSLLAQLCILLFYIFAGEAMGFNVPLTTYFVAVPIAFVVQAVPISPGGIGVSQTATFYLFNLMSKDTGSAGPATTTAHQLFLFLFGLIGAFFYIGIAKKLKIPAPEISSQGALNDTST